VSAATTKEKPPEPALTERLRLEVERAVQRSLKGVELFGAPPPTVGKTAKTVLHRRGTLSLYHYHATADEIYRVPLLFVMAPTNKAYILDLAPGQSLMEFLLARGYDIYMMDWNAPGDDERDLKIEDYVLDFIPDCLRRVQEDSGEDDVTLIGYCAGGMLSAIHVALLPAARSRTWRASRRRSTSARWSCSGRMADARTFDVDQPGRHGRRRPCRHGHRRLRCAQTGGQGRGAAAPLGQPLERRVRQGLPDDGALGQRDAAAARRLLPADGEGAAARQRALRGQAEASAGAWSTSAKITVPFLHVIAQYDHIVPPACAQPLVQRVGSRDKEEVMLPGGHVSIAAGPNAVKRMWPKLDSWLQRRST
jgi:polyhydroxyalkanoate synthase